MERDKDSLQNTIFAILLITMVWTLWPGMNARKPATKAAVPGIQNAAPQTAQATVPGPVAKGEANKMSAKASNAKVATAPVEHVLENDLLKITFSSEAAQMKSIILKDYGESKDKDSARVDLIDRPMLETFGEGALGFSTDLLLEGEPTSQRLNEFSEVSSTATELRYVKTQGDLRIERTYRLKPQSYNVEVETLLVNQSDQVLRPQMGVSWNVASKNSRAGFLAMFAPPPDLWTALSFSAGNKLGKITPKAGQNAEEVGEIKWVSLGSRYFMAAAMPKWQGASKVQTALQTINKDQDLKSTLWSPQIKINPGEKQSIDLSLFLGPKKLSLLEAQGESLNRALDLGFFEMFALFLLRLLQFFHRFLGNWGLSIIGLTILVKIVFFPLTHSSFKSMKEMQRIQPLLNDIREKYKDNREQLNLQMMKIMKEHKVNPLGGCLPMVVQMPIYFALYQVLYRTIELRHAPFYGWIQDLSVRDPLFIWPVVLGVAMFLQQKLSPKPADPVQAKMMNIMPIMFTAMMFPLPSGLVIYIFFNTSISVAQQWYIHKKLGHPVTLNSIVGSNSTAEA